MSLCQHSKGLYICIELCTVHIYDHIDNELLGSIDE